MSRCQWSTWNPAAQLGSTAGTRDQFAAPLPIRERVHGPERPHTLTTRSSLARWAEEAEDAAEAGHHGG
jgi:hypothetical protein